MISPQLPRITHVTQSMNITGWMEDDD